MKNSNQNNLSKQPSPYSSISLVRSQNSIQSYLSSSPNLLNQFLRSSFKVFSEMKEDIIYNQQSKLSLRFEQIHLLMATQKLFLHLQKMQEYYQKSQKQEAFQLIFRLAAIDYSNCSSFFKSPQRCNSPGIVSKDIGMEKKIQNQQLIKIIQELQLQIAGQEICKAVYSFQIQILKDTFHQLRWTIKLSSHLEKIKIIIETFTLRNALNHLKLKAIQTRKFETGLLLINLKIKKMILSNEFYFFYSLKVLSIQITSNTKQKIKKNKVEVHFKLQDESLKLVKLYKFFIRYCYRQPFDQLRKIQYSYQLSDLPLRSSISLQKLSASQQVSQVVTLQQSQVIESLPQIENQKLELQENLQNQIHQRKVEIKSSGKISRSIKQYLNNYEEQYLQIQQQKIKFKLQKRSKSPEQIKTSNLQKLLLKNKRIIYLILLIIIFCFALLCLFI
ncbi:unnamed protein product [Paramecium sonneborni]|uniref:Transmembrane protein n=1 Tax=Paramecium sonneborni TaxID=65129 RepID=A0A8S1L817_9CILI|nr:unnamed protein product [Paramecium sonneborni]